MRLLRHGTCILFLSFAFLQTTAHSMDHQEIEKTEPQQKCLSALWEYIFRNCFRFKDNFAVVNDNLVRSGLIKNETDFEKHTTENDISTLVNTRNKQPHKYWYNTLCKWAEKLGIEFEDVSLDSHKYPTLDNFRKLLTVLRNSHGKLWAMDKEGANRTGLLCAIYQLLSANEELSTEEKVNFALEQFSLWKHGYVWHIWPLYLINPECGYNFVQKFGKTYFVFKEAIAKKNIDLSTMTTDEEETIKKELCEKVGCDALFDYAKIAVEVLGETELRPLEE